MGTDLELITSEELIFGIYRAAAFISFSQNGAFWPRICHNRSSTNFRFLTFLSLFLPVERDLNTHRLQVDHILIVESIFGTFSLLGPRKLQKKSFFGLQNDL